MKGRKDDEKQEVTRPEDGQMLTRRGFALAGARLIGGISLVGLLGAGHSAWAADCSSSSSGDNTCGVDGDVDECCGNKLKGYDYYDPDDNCAETKAGSEYLDPDDCCAKERSGESFDSDNSCGSKVAPSGNYDQDGNCHYSDTSFDLDESCGKDLGGSYDIDNTCGSPSDSTDDNCGGSDPDNAA